LQGSEFLENSGKRKFRQQGSEDSNTHVLSIS
jgi:hypothetical protein